MRCSDTDHTIWQLHVSFINVDSQSRFTAEFMFQITEYKIIGRRYTQDGPANNHFGYTQDSNLTNPKPNPNPNPRSSKFLTETLLCNLIRTTQTHHPCK